MEMAFVKIIHSEKISQFFMELCNKFHGFIETAETRFWKVSARVREFNKALREADTNVAFPFCQDLLGL